jgi:hypothetical protein
MIRNQTLFYATARDLSGVLSSLETQKELQYTLAGLFKSKELQTYFSYRDIPDFGRAFHRSAVANRRYLVSLKGTILRIRDVPQNSGGIRFAVDLLLNEDSIVFSPGGRYRGDVMLYGMVGTLSPPPTAASKTLYTFVESHPQKFPEGEGIFCRTRGARSDGQRREAHAGRNDSTGV